MSKAAKQVVLNTIFSYIGVGIGTISVIYFIPRVFGDQQSAENYGGILVLLNYVSLFVFISMISSPRTIIKFYPSFDKLRREYLISTLFWYQVIALSLTCFLFYIFSENIYVNYKGEIINISPFFYPLIVLFTFNSFLFGYSQVIEKTNFPTFLRDSFVKMWNFSILFLLYVETINFKYFLYLYLFQFLVQFVILFFYIYIRRKDRIRLFNFQLFFNSEILKYTLFSLFAGAAATLVTKVDIQMIKTMINQEVVAYYSFGLFFISVLIIPRNSITTIANNIISRDLNALEHKVFKEKYLRISFIYSLSTLLVFISIILGLEELMMIVGGNYGSETIRNVVIILGLGRVVESMFIINSSLITFSKYFKVDIFFQLLAIILVIVFNIIFIKMYNLIGAAISTSLVFIIISMSRSLFIKTKFDLFPVSKKYLLSLLIISFTILLNLIPTDVLFSFTGWDDFIFPYFSAFIKLSLMGLIVFFIFNKRGIKEEFFRLKKL